MMSSYRRSERHGRLWAATALVVFLFAVDLLSGGRVRGLVRGGAAALSQVSRGAISSITGSGFFSGRRSLETQNRTLTAQLAQYQEKAAHADVLQAENDQLRALVRLAETTSGITAPIVSSTISSPYGTFLIGAGASDGVMRGALVLTAGGFVVGEVTNADAHLSTVTEVLSPTASLNVVVHGTPATLSGSGGGNGHISLPRGAVVSVNDVVLAPELGSRVVGIVGEVASSTAQATQDVYVRLPVALSELQFVYVVPR